MISRFIITLMVALPGAVMCIPPVVKLKEIALLWWKWRDVPGASIHNLEEISYTLGPWFFPNGMLMYVMILGQLALGLTIIGFAFLTLIRHQRQQ